MTDWVPNTKQRQRLPDFLVSYRFLSTVEGGRELIPFQGYRSDLQYEQNAVPGQPAYDGLYMVHPEFLNNSGRVITDTQAPVAVEGLAYMWIGHFVLYREVHRKLAMPGRLCWFMEGARRVAEACVIEQIGLIHMHDPALSAITPSP